MKGSYNKHFSPCQIKSQYAFIENIQLFNVITCLNIKLVFVFYKEEKKE